MRIAIIGSRSFNNKKLLDEIMSDYIDDVSLVVSGGAKGADSLGVQWAKEHNIPYKEYLPDWNIHGKSAGFIRNNEIIENCDEVVAFWDGESKGTKHSMDIAKRKGKFVHVVRDVSSVKVQLA